MCRKNHCTVTATMKLKGNCSRGKKSTTNLDSIFKSRDITASKDPSSKSYGFSSMEKPGIHPGMDVRTGL